MSPWVIGQIMIIITLITPLGMSLTNGYILIATTWFEGPFIYGLLWVFDWGYHGYYSDFAVFNIPFMWLMVPLSIFSILYIRQIVRYYLGKRSRDSALMVGIISVVFPSLLSLLPMILGAGLSQICFIIPIPIQFIAGLIFLHKFEGPEVISPWPGQFIDWSWWKRLRARWSNRTQDLVEMHLDEEKEELDWPESE